MITEIELAEKVEYVVDAEGNQRAVLVDIHTWRKVQETLKQLETYAQLYARFNPSTEINLAITGIDALPTNEDRESLIRSIRGKYAFVPISSEEFAQLKQEEIDFEDRPQ